ncbi:hypothetical protein ACQSET_24140 [Salmonella enterica]|uniref:hypothetical protein n=1 Tax=Salmonella enterica TaxID=28901 RepID=UPI000DF09AAE|nr:hypothetical protein DOE63_03095 [Salmonella enterica subsp. diarizonae serovar 59:z10:-]
MKQKLRRRNQRWLTRQYRLAVLNDMSMSFFIHCPEQQAEMKNADRLERRGKLSPDWTNIAFFDGYATLPCVSLRGKIYYYRIFLSKSELPEVYQSRWLERCSSEDILTNDDDFQMIHHNLERGTEEVIFDSRQTGDDKQ